MSAVTAALALLATYRLTRLIALDVITDGARHWVQARVPVSIAYMIGCPWCLSIWVSVPVASVTVVWGDNRVVLVGLLALSASAAAGILARPDETVDLGYTVDDEHAE